ncbi:MAG: CHC2 zinc finger domain-containing protein [Alphaproteobacteria bacterium]
MDGPRIFTADFLAELKARVGLVDLIGSSVLLKRAGSEWSGLCPFHAEKTPSFTVSDDKGFYHCFGCGAHGDAIDFLMRADGRTFADAVTEAAHRAGMTLPDGAHPAPRRDGGRDVARRAEPSGNPERDGEDAARIELARHLWSLRRPADDGPVRDYLRGRGVTIDPPQTVAFLPGSSRHPSAMIAAFGIADEPEPGRIALADAAVVAVHLTRLGDGDGPRKRIIGRPRGAPIMLAPMNDALGLAISEGIEDGLSIHAATGLGAWAAGSASMLAALADAVPDFADTVTVAADPDPAGLKGAADLTARLRARGRYVETKALGAGSGA